MKKDSITLKEKITLAIEFAKEAKEHKEELKELMKEYKKFKKENPDFEKQNSDSDLKLFKRIFKKIVGKI